MAKILASSSTIEFQPKPREAQVSMQSPGSTCTPKILSLNLNGLNRIRLNLVARYTLLLMIGILLQTSASHVQADVVYRQGLTSPLIGKVTQNDAEGIVLKFDSPQQGVTQILIPRSEVIEHIVTVSPSRLEALKDGDWPQYRDYAEELAGYRLDPQAHQLAIRLYLIVAYHSTQELQASAFRALIEIARSADEEKRLRALAFQVMGEQAWSLLAPPKGVAAIQLPDESAQKDLLQCIRLVRQGAGEQALDLADSPAVQAAFESISNVMTFRDFRNAAYDRNISRDRLKQLVQLELALLGGELSRKAERPKPNSPDWGRLIAEDGRQPFLPVGWETVTEFDPRKSRYQKGTWELP